MSKILKNQTGSPIVISDVGETIPASPATFTIQPQEFAKWAASSDIVGPIGVGDIVVNDGSSDLSISDGIDLIKGIFPNTITIEDITTGKKAEVLTRGDGKNALAIDGTFEVSINELLGKDPLPDTYFTVTNAGAIGDTIRVQIAGTSNDTSTPDRDLPAVDKTTTLTATEVGDEIALAELIVSDLNADTNFQNAKLIADAITTGRRAIVHITVDEDEFSIEGEFSERPNANDVQVSPTGTTTILLNSDKLISRGKVVSLARDPDNPHALGVLGISGSVTALPGTIDNAFEIFAQNGGSDNLLVDGSSTPVVFTVSALANVDVAIGSFHFLAIGSAFKFGQFLGVNTSLSNGVEIKIIANDGKTKTLFLIKNTEDFENLFATSPADNNLSSLPSGDNLKSVRRPRGSAILRKGTSDRIEIKIQDDLTVTGFADDFKFFARGFET